MSESKVFGNGFVFFESIWSNERFDGQVFFGGLEVLSQSNHLYVGVSKIVKGLKNFIFFFAKPKHNSRFGSIYTALLQITQHL